MAIPHQLPNGSPQTYVHQMATQTMIPHTSAALSKIRIWQQNARKSLHNTDYILNEANLKNFDIILLREPWIDCLGKLCGSHNWRIIYPSTLHLNNHNPIRSVILININISTNMYTALDILSSNITTIHLKGDFSHCAIFNIYNDCSNNNTTLALQTHLESNECITLPSPSDHMLWCGNFNHHHPLWEPDSNNHLYNSVEMVKPLIDLITKHNMCIALPLDIPIYKMVTSNWAHPDNVWCNNNTLNPILICDINPSI